MSEQAQLGLMFEIVEPGTIVKACKELIDKHGVEVFDESSVEVADPPEEQQIIEPKKLEEAGQIPLIDLGEWWEEHWRGMPEFVQKNEQPWKSIYVHFESREQMEAFAALVGQQVTLNTKSIWYPETDIKHHSNFKWVEEKQNENIEVLEQG